ncbi:hypothetical protein PBCVKS1B_665R [Paramecium bursaria Chlorella virus KS1B]|nr:hypothetical protein PBCVKS1B_665R [Paramecium bursaria Chlorella virus KS1B]
MSEYTTLIYYEDTTLKKQIYTKYEINKECVIRHKRIKKTLSYHVNKNGYYKVTVYDDTGKSRGISVARAMLSTFVGPPPSPHHTADHKNKCRTDDRLGNLRWADELEQKLNRNMPETLNSAFIIVHDGEELTANEWAERVGVHHTTICRRAQNVRNIEWSYKKYDDLPGENWKLVKDSKNSQGWWMVSDLGRVAYHTENTRKVSSPEELSTRGGYPSIGINGDQRMVHLVVFQTFRPEEYKAMKEGEMVLHEDDDRMDCRIDKLCVGTASLNGRDAHDNGKYDGKKTARRPCVARQGDWSKPFDSLDDAVEWLQAITEYKKASLGHISKCLNGKRKTAYGFTWTSS